MTTNQSQQDIDRLLAEAEELAQRINSDVLDAMEEEYRLQFEIHAQNLERIKSELQNGSDKKKASQTSPDEGSIHEAILDIVKALQGLTKFLS